MHQTHVRVVLNFRLAAHLSPEPVPLFTRKKDGVKKLSPASKKIFRKKHQHVQVQRGLQIRTGEVILMFDVIGRKAAELVWSRR